MIFRSAWLFVLAAALPTVAAAGDGYVDVHMHLHPLGLETAMRGGPMAGQGRPIDLAANLDQAAGHMVRRMGAKGVETALVVVVPSPRQGGEAVYRSMRDAVKGTGGRLRLLAGGATLGPMIQNTPAEAVTPELRARFQARADAVLAEGAVGFGEMISYHLCMVRGHSFQHAPADHPLFLMLADIAAQNDVPIDLHMEAIETPGSTPENLLRACRANPETLTPTIPGLERLLAHNRQARIVWQHIGWDNVGQMRVPLIRRLMEAHPNLYLALRVERRRRQVGGGGPMPNRVVDLRGWVTPAWQGMIEDFQDRIVIGSDEFVGPTGEPPRRAASFDQTWAIVEQMPPPLARKIGRENARRIYRLE